MCPAVRGSRHDSHCRAPVTKCCAWDWSAERCCDEKMPHGVSSVWKVKCISSSEQQMYMCILTSQCLIRFRFQQNVLCFSLLRCFTVPTLTWSGSRETSACTSSTSSTRIRPAGLWTWPDIPSTTCSSTSATWTQTNATSWLTGGFGTEMIRLCDA